MTLPVCSRLASLRGGCVRARPPRAGGLLFLRRSPVKKKISRVSRRGRTIDWQGLLEMLPEIERQLQFGFRRLRGEAREDALQESLVNVTVRYERLVRQGRAGVASLTPLARFAIRQVKSGRTIATRLNVREPLSRYARLRKRFQVERLDHWCRLEEEWLPVLVEDRRISVAEQAALRIDIPNWLSRFARRTRQIAWDLACGFSTGEVARRYRLSPARISQMRREFYVSWLTFHGLESTAAT